jgi:hypothetical protein
MRPFMRHPDAGAALWAAVLLVLAAAVAFALR